MGEAQFEKVEKGLRCHSDVFNEEPDCEHCEYDNANCGLEVPSDALALIRQQQARIAELEAAQMARVMSLKDAEKSDVCWLEIKDMDRVMPCRIRWYYNSYFIKLFEGAPERFTEAEYGTELRCWTKRPTDEQREATPWG